MATDIDARGMAANAKKSVTELGDKIESEKWIGTKAEWEAVDKSTIKDGTIVYITDDETVILYDKAEMEKIAAQVATDRKAAETAAQTAQSIADSLPDDYVTAVGKIAENTAEIANVKLTDKELKRRVDALFDIGQGVTHKFETDTDTAYAKTVPTGAKLMSVKSVGGRSIVFNQFAKNKPFDSRNGITTSTDGNYSVLDGTATNAITAKGWWGLKLDEFSPTNGHKYLFCSKIISGTVNPANGCTIGTAIQKQIVGKSFIFEMSDKHWDSNWLSAIYSDKDTVFNKLKISVMLIDLTLMFGSGNEPSTVEEFEAMFPADYYPYNAGEIVSAGTEEIVEQGKNLWDEVWGIGSINASSGNDEGSKEAIYSKSYTPIIPNSTYIFVYAGSDKIENVKTRFYDHNKKYIGYNDNNGQIVYPNRAFITPLNAFYVRFTLPPMYGNVYKNDIALIAGSSGDYSPFHQTGYPIPEAIRNLHGYGWSAGTAKNYVDYENKRYVQCVNSVDLGTKNWLMYKDGDYTPFFYLNGISDIRGGTSNFLCPKYQYVKIGVTGNESGLYVLENTTVRVRDTAYTDAATFKQAMSGVMLYYELESPIVTDISTLIDDDFLRNIEAESGGSITFKGGNDDYRIPVPSEEEYIVKLSEVGGSV